jgi:hypothetical protein
LLVLDDYLASLEVFWIEMTYRILVYSPVTSPDDGDDADAESFICILPALKAL